MKFVHLRATAWLLLPCFVLPCASCTFVGAGIGHTIPRHGDTEIPTDVRAVPRGTDVTILYRGSTAETPGQPLSTVEGVYRGTDEDRAIIESGHQSYSIPLSRIEQTRARPTSGSYSLEGGLIGLGLDLAAFALLLGMVSRWREP